jgi:hypothetical protein
MRAAPSAQRGMGAKGIFFTLVLLGIVLTLILKLGPSYMGFWTLSSIMDDLAKDPERIQGGRPAIMDRLNKQMDINNVRDMQDKDFSIKKREDNAFDVKVAYERRHHLFYNVDAVLVFSHEVVVEGR